MAQDVVLARLVCAWCCVELRAGTEPTSHGICPACSAKVKQSINPLRWDLPTEQGIDDDWSDAFISTQLQDVMSRRHFGLPFSALSVEDRTLLRGECESFVARLTYIIDKRDR